MAGPGGLFRVGEVGGVVEVKREGEVVGKVESGDYLVGDLNGVVCVPRGEAEGAVREMEKAREGERRVWRDVQAGRGFEESAREHRGKGV